MTFQVIAIPLNRPEILAFLTPPRPDRRGQAIRIIDQRPTPAARARWIERLRTTPSLENALSIHHPACNLITAYTDRLVPVELLHADPDYLTRNLGGWTALYFAVVDLQGKRSADPLLQHARILTDYGPQIQYFGEDIELTRERLPEEFGEAFPEMVAVLIDAYRVLIPREETANTWQFYADAADVLYRRLAGRKHPAQVLLLDALLEALVRVEQSRRGAMAIGQPAEVEAIQGWQETFQGQYGVNLILKGEYIVGRHRRSTILIAPELGVVVKQPGPEPFHEIQLGASQYNGKPENWPVATHAGQLVTPAGRVRLNVEETLVDFLGAAFGHRVDLYTAIGVTVEPFEPGPTVQKYVLEDPRRLTSGLYEKILLHQLVIEELGIENGDWHSANFILRSPEDVVHIDWGAARLLEPHELDDEGTRQRLEQVANIAYSFHDPGLADRMRALHRELLNNPVRLAECKRRAREIARRAEGWRR